ncbi:BLUF domain-containing protein [Oceaniovalibus sp. ACAM 378]|uniref:BLUF domain-containing protein n=1 Tax=Oceaniovalibus sp. ACAM 378 TaxID=2599923 RepID=UPI0011D99E86|nr:BLUF domain-containing protein [Oceaniovalibus sp. ACAM 378]TYB83737.1 BLUF domain-containing protein [Oceaniovalibus sp. ACAM 378]
MLSHIAYVSRSCSPLDAKFLSDILEVSVRNNERDGIGGVLMYHDQLFFQILEGEGRLVEQCYGRICRDPRHSGISIALDETVEARSFPDWLMGYVGPDEIGEHTGGAMLSLAGLNAPELSDGDKRGHALELARIMFKKFSKR